MKKNCKNCNLEFQPRQGNYNHIFCSKKCKNKFYPTSKRGTIEPIVCQWCGKTTMPLYKTSKTCGGECAKLYRKKHKAERVKVHIIDRECKVCGKNDFKQWSNFNRHITVCSKRNCIICDKEFISSEKRIKTCSDLKCKTVNVRMVKYKYKEKIKLYPTEKECIGCPETFMAKNGQHKYCSTKCKQKTPAYRLKQRIGAALRNVLHNKGILKNNPTFDLLGYTGKELYKHIESLFTDGMSWDNMGDWHIDHIRPVASFNFTTTECEDFKKCWALENLQPLWAKDNLSKGSKWNGKRWRVEA